MLQPLQLAIRQIGIGAVCGCSVVRPKPCRFNYALILLLAHSKELLHHNQMFLFLRVLD